MSLSVGAWSDVVSGVMLVTLAAVLMVLDVRSRPVRAFALLLVLRGFSTLAVALASGASDPETAALGARLFPYSGLALPAAALYLAAVYPAWRRRPATALWAAVVLWGSTALLVGAYAFDHERVYGDGAWPEFRGPLGIFSTAWLPAYGVVALVWLGDAFATPPGVRRSSVLLVSLGFALYALYVSVGAIVAALHGGVNDVRPVSALLAVVPLAALVLRLARAAARAQDLALRGAARKFLASLALPVASVLPVAAFPSPDFDLIMGSVWRAALPLLVAYALVRHQIFDIDVKIRWTLKQSTVAAVFLAVFFLASESAQAVLSDRLGTFVGIGAAALLVFAIAPLQRVAERVASAAMPGVRPAAALSASDRLSLYRDEVEFAWSDGRLSPDERLLLDHMRQRLGLTLEEAAGIETEAARAAGARDA